MRPLKPADLKAFERWWKRQYSELRGHTMALSRSDNGGYRDHQTNLELIAWKAGLERGRRTKQ